MSYFEKLLLQCISTEGLFGFGSTDIGEIEMKPVLKEYRQGGQITLTHVKFKQNGVSAYSAPRLPLISGREPITLIADDVPYIVNAVKALTTLVSAIENDGKIKNIDRDSADEIRQYFTTKYKHQATEFVNNVKSVKSIRGMNGVGRKISFTLPSKHVMENALETIRDGISPVIREIDRITSKFGSEVAYWDFSLGIRKLRNLLEDDDYPFDYDPDEYYRIRDNVFRGTIFNELFDVFTDFCMVLSMFVGYKRKTVNSYLKNIGLSDHTL